MVLYRDITEDYFRIVTVLISDEDVPLSIGLKAVPISKTEYICVSYSWNNEVPSIKVRCNDEDLMVTSTIYDFLLQMRREARTIGFWIDGICIDQSDINDKAKQVPHMGRYYSQAREVLVWLGNDTGHTYGVFDDLSRVANAVDQAEKHAKSEEKLPELFEEFNIPPRDDAFWKGLGEILARTWFTRLWCLQEVALAKSAALVCGSQSIDLMKCYSMLIKLSGSFGRYFFENFYREVMPLLYNIARLQHETSIDFELVESARSRNTTYQIDRVYAILGLMTDDVRDAITVDYSAESRVDYWKQYLQFGRALTWHRDPETLFIQATNVISPSLNLPSWCPDLSATSRNLSPLPLDLYWVGTPLGCSRAALAPDNTTLVVEGLISKATIEACTRECKATWIRSFIERPDNSPESRQDVAHIISDWLEECMRTALNESDVSQEKWLPLARCLVAGGITDFGGKPEEESHFVWPVEKFVDLFFEFLKVLDITKQHPAEAWKSVAKEKVGIVNKYTNTLLARCQGRKFFRLSDGALGLGPGNLENGDSVLIVQGSRIPFIVRYIEGALGAPSYKIIGETYLDDRMNLIFMETPPLDTFNIM